MLLSSLKAGKIVNGRARGCLRDAQSDYKNPVEGGRPAIPRDVLSSIG